VQGSSRCALGSPSRPTPRRSPGAFGIDRSSEPSRRRRIRGPSPEPPRSPPCRLLRRPPDAFELPSGGPRDSDASQRRRRRRARSVSASSQPRCTVGFTSGPTLSRPRGALGSDRSSEPSRRRCMRGPSPEPRRSPHGCPPRPAPAHFQSPSDDHRGAAISQRRRRRSARSVSVSSQPRCTLGFTSGPTLRRPRRALGSNRSSEPNRRRRMRGPSWTEVDLPTCMTTVWVRTYDGTHAVPTTVPVPYLRRNSPGIVPLLSIF
jgi:hypothetical protein